MTGVTAQSPSDQATPMIAWVGFIAMCLGMFMAILDIQIVVTSLPAIRKALNIPADSMSWVQTSYLVAEIIAIPLTGFLTRALSLRGLFLSALSVFVAASAACAFAPGFEWLIAGRIVQGLAGGCLIPLVFSAVFLLFKPAEQGIATTIAGALAVLAPTLGPTLGGYITQTYSWPWLFLVNIGPGIVSLAIAAWAIPSTGRDPSLLRRIDWLAIAFLAIALAALEIGLKEGPKQGWASPLVASLLTLFFVSGFSFVRRTLGQQEPITHLRLLADRNFAVACTLSFVFGIGLFSSVYLMPVFLGLVRSYGPLEIGLVMIVTGIVQLLTAPVVVQLELRADARVLTAVGFVLFAVGMALSGFQTRDTGFDEMFWPQVVRGVAIMFCLIPPTRLALGYLDAPRVPDGSAMFNLMRNLGGAIGIAAVDTIMWQRTPVHVAALIEGLKDRDPVTARFVGIPMSFLPDKGIDPTAAQIAMAKPVVEKAGLVLAINEGWLSIACITALALLPLLFARRVPHV